MRVLEHAVREDLPGVYNAAADGVLALSEIAGLLGKPLLPSLPPWGTGLVAGPLQAPGPADARGDAQPAALRPRPGQPQAQGAPATTSATRRARPSRASPSTCACATCATATAGLPLRARGRGVPALQPERPAPGRPVPAGDFRRARALAGLECREAVSYHLRASAVKTRLIVIAALLVFVAPRGGGGRLRLRQRPLQTDRRGRVDRRDPGRRDEGRAGARQAAQRRARAAEPAGRCDLQGPQVHADAEGGERRRRHRRLGPGGAWTPRARATSISRTWRDVTRRQGQARRRRCTSPTRSEAIDRVVGAGVQEAQRAGARRERRTSRRAR